MSTTCSRSDNSPVKEIALKKTAAVFAAALSIVAFKEAAYAQTLAPAAKAAPANAAPAPTPIRIGKNTTLSLSVRTRLESWDYFQGKAGIGGDAGDGKYNFLGNLVRVGVLNSTPERDLQLEISQPTLLGLPRDAIASGAGTAGQGALGLGGNYYAANLRRNDASLFVKQAFVKFKGLGGAPGNSLKLGRFEFNDGSETVPKDASLAYLKRERISQRLLGNFGFSHIQRSFDGAQLVLNTPQNNFTLAALRPTAGVFDVDANGELGGVSALYAAYTRPKPESDLRIFAAYYKDDRENVVKVDNRPLAVRAADKDAIAISTLGANYLQTIETKNSAFDLLAWGALQGGDWGNQKHRAGALALEAGYQPKHTRLSTRLKPWFRVGYFKSSGDKDASDGRHETFFQMLPTPRVYARLPFYNLMNNEDIFAQMILRPDPKTTFRLDAHRVNLSSANDLYYSGGGAFQKDSFGYAGRPSFGLRGLANVFDISVDRQVSAHTTLAVYLGTAQGRGVISRIYQKQDSARFAYVEVTQKF